MKKYLIFSFVFLATLAFGASTAFAQNAPYITISANPTTVQYNGTTTISYTVTGATSCQGSMGSLGWSGAKSTSGGSLYTTPLTATTTYVLTCTNNFGSMTKSVTVTVSGSGGGSGGGGGWSGGGGCNTSCGGGNTYPPTVNISANPTLVSYNGSSTISWSATGATSCYASGGTAGWSGSKATSGSFYANSLTSTTTFNISCTNSYGTTNQSTTVSVQPYNPPQNPLPTVSISADQIFLAYNGTTYIRWNVTNATACQAYGGANGWAGSKNINGGSFFTGQMTQNATYKIICYNSSGQDEASVTVSVDAKPAQNPTVTLIADQSNLQYGQGTYVRWSTANATECSATGGTNNWAGYKNPAGGSFYTGTLSSGTKTYTITCTNSNGSATDSVQIYVGQQSNTQISVQTNSASNIFTNSATLNGYVNLNNGNYANTWFEWGSNSNLSNQTNRTTLSQNSNISHNLGGLQSNTTYYFRAVAQNENGEMFYGSQQSFTTSGGCNYNCGGNYDRPNVTTYSATDIRQNEAMLNGYVDGQNSYTTRWFEWGTNYGNLYNSTNRYSQGSNYGNFGERISGLQPNTTYYFRAVAQNSNGIAYGNIFHFTTSTQYYQNNCYNYGTCAPHAVTTIATNIGGNGARLNGLGAQDMNVQMTGYFEYGLTQSLGRTTPSAFIGSGLSNPFNATVLDLVPGTTYYYRAVVSTQYGVSRGDIQTFRTDLVINNTSRTTVINRTIVTNNSTNTNTNTGVGLSKPSLVFLTIDRGGEIINIGEEITYNIYYKNVSTKDLRDVVLRVALPKELDFVSTSRGYWSEENNTVVVNIGSLFSQEEGSVRVTALVTRTAEVGKITVVTANIAYTINEDGSQEEVFAYSKNNVENNRIELRGTAFFGAGFWPDTLAGWLILLLLILLIILVLRLIYSRMFPAKTITTNTNTGQTTTTFHH